MKEFFKKRSYDIVKMFLNQFATAVFGFVLALAAGKAKNPTLRNITGVFAVLFYLFLLYTMTWEIGFRDKIPVEKGRQERKPMTGLWISLCANSLNLLLAILIMLANLFHVSFFGTVGGIAASTAVLIEGMYTGLLANRIHGVALNSYWWMYFLITIPSMVTCTVAYILGLRDKKFTGLFKFQYPASDREPVKKKDPDGE